MLGKSLLVCSLKFVPCHTAFKRLGGCWKEFSEWHKRILYVASHRQVWEEKSMLMPQPHLGKFERSPDCARWVDVLPASLGASRQLAARLRHTSNLCVKGTNTHWPSGRITAIVSVGRHLWCHLCPPCMATMAPLRFCLLSRPRRVRVAAMCFTVRHFLQAIP